MALLARAYHRQLPLERAALTAAVDLASVRREDRLLDVATGTGGLLGELAGRDTWPMEAIGLDRSGAGLAVAAAWLPDVWQLMAGDARRLPFADNRFHVVTACYVLHLLSAEDRAAVLNEIVRVLRPGGRVVSLTVESRRQLSRAALGLLPRASGLRPYNPAGELAAAGLHPVRARFTRTGWPSLCLLATRD